MTEQNEWEYAGTGYPTAPTDTVCYAHVSRNGRMEPCHAPAHSMRFDWETDKEPWPVCARHHWPAQYLGNGEWKIVLK